MIAQTPLSASPDIRTVIGNDTPLHRVTKKELAGPCPKCGGVNRFRVSLDRNLCVCSHCHDRDDHWLTPTGYIMWHDDKSYLEARAKLDGTPFSLPPALKPAPPGTGSDLGPVVKVYDYEDEHGVMLYQACRHEPKAFSQRRPATDADIELAKTDKTVKIWRHGNGSRWVWNLDEVRRILYRTPELLARPKSTVFITEGEKDADTVLALGLLATTNAMGAAHWRPEYTEQLRGRHIAVLPDNDTAGGKRIKTLTDALASVAATFVVVTLPGSGKDITDWVTAGGTKAELQDLVLAARKDGTTLEPVFPGEIGADELALMVFAPPVAYVPGILYEGATLYAAPPKSGKSISTLGMCVSIASGGTVFSQIKVAKRRVLYFSLEDPIELVQERLFTMMRGSPFPPLLRILQTCPALNDMHAAIEEYVRRFPDTGVVVIDTLAHARGATPRTNKDIVQQDYQELIGFSHLAHKLHIAIVIITHTAKAQYDDELAQVSGTFGLSGAVDAIMILNRKRHSPEATLAIFSRRLGSEKKYELHWEEQIMSYVLDGEMTPEKATRTTSTAIIDCLADASAPLSIRSISELCQITYEVAKQRLWQLLKSGEIIKTDDGKYALQKNPRNRRNFVTDSGVNDHGFRPSGRNQERNQPLPDDDGWEPSDNDDGFSDLEDVVTDRNQSHQSNGYEVTAVTALSTAPVAGGYGPDNKAPF